VPSIQTWTATHRPSGVTVQIGDGVQVAPSAPRRQDGYRAVVRDIRIDVDPDHLPADLDPDSVINLVTPINSGDSDWEDAQGRPIHFFGVKGASRRRLPADRYVLPRRVSPLPESIPEVTWQEKIGEIHFCSGPPKVRRTKAS
jgi:hypothetical protein